MRERLTEGLASHGVLVGEGVAGFGLETVQARKIIAEVGEHFLNEKNVSHWRLPGCWDSPPDNKPLT